mgnify:FL=1
MEWFDLYDKDGNKLPKKMPRGGSNHPGEYHLVVHVWIRDSLGRYLIQQRNKRSDLVPHQWGITGGAVTSGETSLAGALRETYEEIGLTLDQAKLRRVHRYVIDHPKSNYITDLYLYEEDVLLNDLKLDTVEVRNVDYKTMDEIRAMITEGTFWDYERLLERQGYLALLEKS